MFTGAHGQVVYSKKYEIALAVGLQSLTFGNAAKK
jgi:hypothetical protein